MMTVLVIPSRESDGGDITQVLTGAGFRVISVEDIGEVIDNLFNILPDLIVLVDDSPERGQLCSRVRNMSDIPIITIAGSEDVIRRAMMLELGADACMSRPINPHELVARAHTLLRRYRRSGSTKIDQSRDKSG